MTLNTLPNPLRSLPDLSDLNAYRLFRQEAKKNHEQLKLSKTRFFLGEQPSFQPSFH